MGWLVKEDDAFCCLKTHTPCNCGLLWTRAFELWNVCIQIRAILKQNSVDKHVHFCTKNDHRSSCFACLSFLSIAVLFLCYIYIYGHTHAQKKS